MLQKQEKTGCPPLTDIALEALASNIRQVPSLVGWTGQVLPEELSCSLLEVSRHAGRLQHGFQCCRRAHMRAPVPDSPRRCLPPLPPACLPPPASQPACVGTRWASLHML